MRPKPCCLTGAEVYSAATGSSSGSSGSVGLSAFSDGTVGVGADKLSRRNPQLSLASNQQEQSIFFQPTNI